MPPAPTIESVARALRDFAHRAGALRVVALLDRGADAAALTLACEPGQPVALQADGRLVTLADERLAAAPALALPEVKPLPPMRVDVARAEIVAPLGSLAFLARGVRELAGALGGRSVLSVAFATSDPAAPLLIAARSGEPIELALGDEQFTMPAGWP